MTSRQQEKRDRWDIVAFLSCVLCLGAAVVCYLTAVVRASWAICAVGQTFTLIGYLLTYVGDDLENEHD